MPISSWRAQTPQHTKNVDRIESRWHDSCERTHGSKSFVLELDNPTSGAQVMEQMASRLRQHQVVEPYRAVTGPSHGESTGNTPSAIITATTMSPVF